jgi:hypothetical protein
LITLQVSNKKLKMGECLQMKETAVIGEVAGKCIECGRFLEPLTEEHKQWYKEHDMSIPKRCPLCLKKKPKMIFESTPHGIGHNAIRDAFEKANYDPSNLPEVSNKPATFKAKVVEVQTGNEYYIAATASRQAGKSIKAAELDTKATISLTSKVAGSTVNAVAVNSAAQITNKMAVETNHFHKCIECDSTFIMSDSDEKWYTDRGWPIPKRCESCRAKKAEKKAAPQLDTEEKMNEHICTECNEVFLMSERHEKWFTDKGLLIPTRCPKCVAKRKADKAAAAQ